MDPLALYIHIPFCAARCPYCDFNTYAGLEALYEPYVAALTAEIRRTGAALGRPSAHTIFIGGGTPTVLSPALLAQTLTACRESFDVAADAEITSEANPGTVDQARFAALREMGVNRLSMGVQSFDDAELRWLGRIHTAAEAERAFAAAREAGFANINLDFIFGLPDQDPATWARTLVRAIDLSPEHLALYSLIVEDGTPLADQVRRGSVPEPDDDLAADLYEMACQTLADAGYLQYEISNWARGQGAGGRRQETGGRRPSEIAIRKPVLSADEGSQTYPEPSRRIAIRCRHNLVYWRYEPYLGFGAGAHSYNGSQRWWNVREVRAYIERVSAGATAEEDGEEIDRRLAMGEMMMVGLRLVVEGVPDARFQTRFGIGLEDVFSDEIDRLVARGLLERLPERVRLTPNGRLLGNRVFGAFLPAAKNSRSRKRAI